MGRGRGLGVALSWCVDRGWSSKGGCSNEEVTYGGVTVEHGDTFKRLGIEDGAGLSVVPGSGTGQLQLPPVSGSLEAFYTSQVWKR